jgi:hypothetical protein
MRWLVWTEGSQVLFIRLMEEWPKGFSKAATPLQNHNTGLWVQDSIIGNKEHFSEFVVYWTTNSTVLSASHNPVPLYSLPLVRLQCVQVQCRIWQLSLQRAEFQNLDSVHLVLTLLDYSILEQGSLSLDFKWMPYSFGPCRESLLKGRQWGKPLWGQGLHNFSVNPVQSDLTRKICRGHV